MSHRGPCRERDRYRSSGPCPEGKPAGSRSQAPQRHCPVSLTTNWRGTLSSDASTKAAPHCGQYSPSWRINGASRIAPTNHVRKAPAAAALATPLRVAWDRPGTTKAPTHTRPKAIIAPIQVQWKRWTLATLAAKSALRNGTGPTDPEDGRERGRARANARILRRVRHTQTTEPMLRAT